MSAADASEPTFEADDVDRPVLALLRRYGADYAPFAVVGIVVQLLAYFPGQAIPAVVGFAFDAVLADERPFALPLVPDRWLPVTEAGQLYAIVAIFALLVVLSGVLKYVRGLAWGKFNYNFQHDVRTGTYDVAQRLEMGFFDDHRAGEIMSVLNNDVNEFEGIPGSGTFLYAAGFFLWAGGFMVVLHWQFATVIFAVMPIILVLSARFSVVIERAHDRIQQAVGELNARLQNNVSGISVIKANAAEEFESDRVERASRAHYRRKLDALKIRIGYQHANTLVSRAALLLTLGVGGYWVIVGPPGPYTAPLTPGLLVTFLLYSQQLGGPLGAIPGIVDEFTNARASAKRILGLQAAASPVPERADAITLEDPDGRVEYDGVTFGYRSADEPVLSDVSFEIEPGETVGIVGPTGAGKSTLVTLLLRFYDPDDGAIRLDGHDLRAYSIRDLRRSIGYVSQEPFLFAGTVRENLTYGLEDADDGAVREAAEVAGATTFVENLPDGYDTRIGERGVKLSGGQRQRLCLARAFLRDPSIMVLDEATSHVDNETEALIQRSIADVVEGRTTFTVAHRLSTVRDADRILVLDDGRVVQQGSHEELVARDGLYANLWNVQAGDVQSLPDAFLERVERRADRVVED
ncbi:ABC transporter ATP-binding protein [Halomontanus rarus]|uniref:ABC transporter ATP-binding protein n=1 Tax=Halomontanus rarus TaxID=3034020 RepID=UPI0023E8F21B|nr:ABC transporter ATP-binding protein [Halovivax sp. TS33]